MKKIFISLCLLCAINITALALPHPSMGIQQTHVKIKDAHKAMLNVITYNKEGNILQSGYGFFIDEEGTGIASFSVFKDAYKAVVIDFKGNQYDVHRILGADSNYDLAKFTTSNIKKIESFDIAAASADSATMLKMSLYTGKKKGQLIDVDITDADNFEKYKYYKTSAANVEKNLGCPLINEEGEVVAIIQKNVEDKAEYACAIDAQFINELSITSTSILNADLISIHISKALPGTEKEALTYIYMLGNKDSLSAINALNDFVESYPENAEGYSNRSSFHAIHHNYDLCEADMNKAFELAENEGSSIKADGLHYNFSKTIYNDVLNTPTDGIGRWTLDQAIQEAQKAYDIQPSPHYLLQQAHCYLAKKEYDKAYENYYKINTNNFTTGGDWSAPAQAETWIYAARAYELGMKANGKASLEDSLHIIALIDSAISVLPQPYSQEAAQYILERAQRYELTKQYRKAVMDYYEYEKIIGPKNLNDNFYYLREQAEIKCHMYQQALDDIRTAIAFNPQNPFYPVEEAIVLLQAGLFKEAIETCKKSLQSLPENPDCYKIMGIAYGELKDKKLALECLKKAQALGDPTVEVFIQKYQ